MRLARTDELLLVLSAARNQADNKSSGLSEGKTQIDGISRLLAICGIIGPIFFTTVVVILGLLRPGYSHLAQAVSELGEVGAPNAIVQDINFIMLGLLTLAFAFGLHLGIGAGRGSKIGPALLAVFAVVAGVGNGLLPCDPGCKFVTLTGIMHNITGLTGFVAFIATALTIARRLREDSLWQRYSSYSLVTGVFAVLFLVLFILSSEFFPAWRGGFQRLFVGAMLLWIELMAIRLFQVSRLGEEL